MKTLLWKEYRENAYKVLLGVGACLAIHVMRMRESFNHWFTNDIDEFALWFGIVSAIILAMEAVAGERARGSFDFLMARPVSALRLLLPKFAVGAVGLFVITAAFWVMAYATPLDTGEDHLDLYDMYILYTMVDISYLTMVLAWFLPMLVVYGVAVVGSSLTQDPVRSIAASVLLGWMIAALVMATYPAAAGVLLTHLRFDWQGTLLKATETGPLINRTVIAAVCAALTLLAAAAITRRIRGTAVGWRPLIACGVVLTVGPAVAGALSDEKDEVTRPVGWLGFEKNARDMVLCDSTAYILVDDGLVAVDLSRPDSLVGETILEMPDWVMSHLAIRGRVAIAQGVVWDEASGDAVVLAVSDIEAPGAARLTGICELELDEGAVIEDVAVTTDGDALVWSSTPDRSSLLALQIDGSGSPSPGDVLTFDNPAGRYPHGGAIFTTIGKPHIQIVDQYAFVGLRSGLAIVDVSDASSLITVSMTELEAGDRRMGWVRKLSVSGDTLLVARHWPGEIVMMDVSDPKRPEELETVHDPTPVGHASRLAGRYLFWYQRGEIEIYDVLRRDGGYGLEDLDLGNRGWSSRSREIAYSQGHVWALQSMALLAFRPRDFDR